MARSGAASSAGPGRRRARRGAARSVHRQQPGRQPCQAAGGAQPDQPAWPSHPLGQGAAGEGDGGAPKIRASTQLITTSAESSPGRNSWSIASPVPLYFGIHTLVLGSDVP